MPPNILLIVLDCVRADGLHAFGNPRPITPRLDALAADARRYQQARSASVWTLPSHASLFTGRHPRQHGVDFEQRFLAPTVPTVAEMLQSLGYQTVGLSTNAWVGPHFGLDRGFESFYALWRLRPTRGASPFPFWEKALRKRVLERKDKGAAKLNRFVQKWWREERDPARPFFMFALFLDAHLPYQPPAGYAETLAPASTLAAARRANQDAWAYMAGEASMTASDFDGLRLLYDAEIAYLDAQVGELLDFLRANGGLDDTIIIVTADHGENIGDHALMDHQYCVYESLARVPLIVHHPAAFAAADDFSPVQHTDILPTLLHLIEPQVGRAEDLRLSLPGRSLLDPPDAERPAVIQYTAPHRHRFARRHPSFDPASRGYDRTFDAIVLDDHKLIRSNHNELELYDIAADPDETTDLATTQPDRAAVLARALDDWLAAHPPGDHRAAGREMDDGLEAHFRGLGYL